MKIELENGANLTDNTQEIDKNSIFVQTALNAKYAHNLTCKTIAPCELKRYLKHSPKIIGITGTNGKTTTASCIYSMLLTLGFKAALCGTRGFFINDKRFAPKNLTTPLLLELYYFIHLASIEQCDYFIMEVSSHAIAQKRIEGLDFALKILSNIQSDHLDFHKTLQDYIATKNSFFSDEGAKLINKDCDLARFNPINAYTYGIENSANLKVEAYGLRPSINAMISWNDFKNKTSTRTSLESSLNGKYNLYNVICAIAAVQILCPKITLEKIANALNEFGGVEGRMQVVHKNPLVIVDFAHTAEGMQNIFEAFLGEKIVALFGAGGNRDKTKRPKMGKIAEIYAHKIYLTSDNPRNENPSAILDDILSGISDKLRVVVELNRKNAILLALGALKSDEILLILGKGDESYQIIGESKIPFDDRQIVREFYKNA